MTEAVLILLPDLGEGLTEAQVVAWHVSVGEVVTADQPLLAVETDKAIVDIPAPYAGEVTELCVTEGTMLSVGAVLARLQPDVGALVVESPLLTNTMLTDAVSKDAGAIVGQLPTAEHQSMKPAVAEATSFGNRDVPRASPKARHRARELGIDLRQLVGLGGDEVRVLGLADVERFAAINAEHALQGLRRTMARRMQRAQDRVARANVAADADITAWAETDPSYSLMQRLIRAVAVAVAAQPLLNFRFDDTRLTLCPQSSVDVGVAMQVEQGLVVPVVRAVQGKSLAQISAALSQLREAAQQRRLTPEQLREPSITVSNFGAVGGRYADMVVMPPQVAIVGAGRAGPAPFVRNGELVIATLLPLSLSFDHRVITGIEACLFLNSLIVDLQRTEHELAEPLPELGQPSQAESTT